MKKTYVWKMVLVFLVLAFGLGASGLDCDGDDDDDKKKHPPATTFSLTIVVQPAGTGTVNPNGGTFAANSVVTLTAAPIGTWIFDYWEGTNNNTINPTTVTMTGNLTVIAHYKSPTVTTYTLTISNLPSAVGSVNATGGTYIKDDVVPLTATPLANWVFDYWEGTDNNTINPTTVTMTGNKNVIAHYKSAITYRLPWLDFSPFPGNTEPGNITPAQLRQEIAKVAPFVLGLRVFFCTMGMDQVPAIAEEFGLKVVMSAELTDNLAQNELEMNCVINIAQIEDNIEFVCIGNETQERKDITPAQQIAYVNEFRTAVPDVPVTTADTWWNLKNNPAILAACDIVFYNVYPYWEGIGVTHAVAYVRDIHIYMTSLAAGRLTYISEIGWPSGGFIILDAVPNPANAAFFFKNMASWAQAENITYFYFEACNELWKTTYEGTPGRYWGIWDENWVIKPGMMDVFNGKTMADNWSGTASIPGGAGTPLVEIVSYPPAGDTNPWIDGQVWHVLPANYKLAVYIQTPWGYYNKPTWTEPLTKIYPDGFYACKIFTNDDDAANTTGIIVFLLPATYSPPILNGGALPASLYTDALDWTSVSR